MFRPCRGTSGTDEKKKRVNLDPSTYGRKIFISNWCCSYNYGLITGTRAFVYLPWYDGSMHQSLRVQASQWLPCRPLDHRVRVVD